MEDFWQQALLFIDRWSYVFYAVGFLGVLLYLLRAREAYRQRRHTPFPIEREEATAMFRDSLLILVILVAILATTFYIDRVLLEPADSDSSAPSIAVSESTATPTSPAIGPFPTAEGGEPDSEEVDAEENIAEASPAEAQGNSDSEAPAPEPEPTATPEVADPEPTNTSVASPTVEATAIPTQPPPPTETPVPPTPEPPPPPTAEPPPANVPTARCNTPGVQITSPANGQAVSGNLTIAGTANIDGFQFYKVEYAVNGTEGPYASIGDIMTTPVTNGTLMTWNTGGFPPGVWNIRLTVVDQTGNFPAPCDIFVVIR